MVIVTNRRVRDGALVVNTTDRDNRSRLSSYIIIIIIITTFPCLCRLLGNRHF